METKTTIPKLPKTRQELLDNVVGYYNSERRANDGASCSYHTKDGRRCAVGISVTLRQAKILQENYRGCTVWKDDVFDALPERLKDMGKDFLYAVQKLHDGDPFWDKNGLTEEGKKKVKKICDEWVLNFPKNER